MRGSPPLQRRCARTPLSAAERGLHRQRLEARHRRARFLNREDERFGASPAGGGDAGSGARPPAAVRCAPRRHGVPAEWNGHRALLFTPGAPTSGPVLMQYRRDETTSSGTGFRTWCVRPPICRPAWSRVLRDPVAQSGGKRPERRPSGRRNFRWKGCTPSTSCPAPGRCAPRRRMRRSRTGGLAPGPRSPASRASWGDAAASTTSPAPAR